MSELFLKDHVTQDRSNDAENLALHHSNGLHLTIYSNIKQLLYIVKLYFGSNQCRLGEQKRLLKKKNILLFKNF